MNKQNKIAILGFGAEGQSMLKYLQRHEFPNITVCDQNVEIKRGMPDGVSVQFGKNYLDNLGEFDVIFRSPGIKFLTPQVQDALQNGAEVTSVIKFFMDECPCPVIGVTGTKGKGTTSTLIYKILKAGGKNVYIGGNIGEPPIDFLDKLTAEDVVVLEMSSFQLQDLDKSPHMAVFLNTTVDHLDYHADREEYMEAKENLLAHQGKKCVAVLNKDYPYVKYYSPLVKGKLLMISAKSEVKDGAFLGKRWIYYSKKGKKEEIIDVKEIGLIGSHNLENVMPAVCIGEEFGISGKIIAEVLREFKGLPHRLEFVRELNGVKYYNDSFSTTPETSMAAVDSFDKPTILIAGGSEKGHDFKNWAIKILTKPSLVTVILIGDTAGKMENALIEAERTLRVHGPLGSASSTPTRVLRRKDLDEAILEAYAEAKKDWVVVMSPACASFGLFKNYKERGGCFRQTVASLT